MTDTIEHSSEITLADYWRIIRKRKATIILVFVLVFISTVIFTKTQTPVYEALMELKIEKQQPVISSGKADQVISIEMPWDEINLATEIRLIKSLPIMRKVVEKMEVLPADPEEREKAIHSLSSSYQGRVQVEQVADTNIIKVRVFSNNPENAALIATAIADVYIVENVEARKRQSRVVIKYIETQLAEYQKQLSEQEDRLQKFKQDEKVFEVTPEIKASLNRMTVEGTFEFEADMLKMDHDLSTLTEALRGKDSTQMFKLLNDEKTSQNFIFTGLKRRLLEFEFERFLLLIDYTDQHPGVLQKDAVIDAVKNKIVSMIKDYSDVPITPEAEGDLALMLKKLFLEIRREVSYRIVNGFYEESGSLSSNQMEYVGLKRSIERLVNSYDALMTQRNEVKLGLAKIIDDVITVVSPPHASESPIKPNAGLNYMVSIVVGLMLGVLVCFIQESIDTSVATIKDVEHELKLSMLGIIPHMRREDLIISPEEEAEEKDKKLLLQRARLVTINDPKSWFAESIKMLRTNIIQLAKRKNLQVILFTSSDKQEGKSTIVTNLACSIAQLGKKVVILGSNLRRPTLYKTFGLNREPGLTDILMGNISWKDAINTSTDILTGGLDIDKLVQMPGLDNLKIITAGRVVDNVSEILNSRAYEQLLRELKSYFDMVIVDCSPVMAVPDAITLSEKVDGVVLVYKVGLTGKDVLKMAKSNLVNARANILGIVLNDIRTEAQVGYSAYYYRYYGEAEKKKEGLMSRWKIQWRRKSQASEKTPEA